MLKRLLRRFTLLTDATSIARAERLIAEGRRAESEGRLNEACAIFREAVRAAPRHAAGFLDLGIALVAIGDRDGASAAYEAALAIDPANTFANYNYANLLYLRGDLARAELYLRRALSTKSDFPEAHVALSNVLDASGNAFAAAASLEAAIRLRPDYAGALFNYGIILRKLDRGSEAVAALRRSLELDPQNLHALDALSTVLREQGLRQESLEPLRAAMALAPERFDLESRALFALNFDETVPAEEIFDQHRDFGMRLERAFPQRFGKFLGAPDPGRRLRIGYVSGDFRLHPVSQFALVPIERHNRSAFEVYCYSTASAFDQVTERIRAVADHWVGASALSDEELADAVHRDAIDILVDLSGHTGTFRLAMFALRPAPVQVAWVGYLNTTGLTRMHYRICDEGTDPTGLSDLRHSETLIRMPYSQWCYRPTLTADAAEAAPCAANGHITFGSFNHAVKISAAMCERWAEILLRLKDAHLAVVGVSSAQKQEALRSILTRAGVEAGRLTFVPYVSLDKYAQWLSGVDIALDTMPYGGGTTTFDALWMGVPVVTAVGTIPASRSAASILSILGLREWIAPTPQDYVSVAVERARDRRALAELRRSLRSMMQDSPLMDEVRFVRDLESAYGAMWRNWCVKSVRP